MPEALSPASATSSCWVIRAAQAISLVGEYNQWDPKPEHWAVRNEFGVWELFLPDSADGEQAIPHR